jgi:HSF-type DNA-binding
MDHQQQDEQDEKVAAIPMGEKLERNRLGNDTSSIHHPKIARSAHSDDENKAMRQGAARKPDKPDSPNSRTTKDSPERKGVPHVYRDFSNVPDSVSMVRKKTGGVATPFPEKLHHMLSTETKEHPSAVSWLPHGRAFLVRDPHEFTDFIMPK